MTRSELIRHLNTLSSGTIADTIGSSKYTIIDRAINSAVIYAAEEATEAELSPIESLADILGFLKRHATPTCV